MTFPKYPSIVRTQRRPEIFSVKEVIATEKLHGSNFRIHFPAGVESIDDVEFGSREIVYKAGDGFPLMCAVKLFIDYRSLLQRMLDTIRSYGFTDTTVFGEAIGPGIKTTGVSYTSGSGTLFRAFDVMVGENFLTYDLFCEVIDKMGLARVQEIWRGDPTMEMFDSLLDHQSVEGRLNGVLDRENIAEGVVIRSNPLLRNVFGEWLIVKHKSTRFSEIANAPTKSERQSTSEDTIAARFVTPGRVQNVIGHLRDLNTILTSTMKDMPILLAAVIDDIAKEEPGVDASDKRLKSSISKVLAPIYRSIIDDKAQ